MQLLASMWRRRVLVTLKQVRRTLRKDRRRRLVKSRDSWLLQRTVGVPVELESRRLGTNRRLRAEAVDRMSLADRSRQLRDEITRVCARNRFESYRFVEGPSQRPVIAVPDEVWPLLLREVGEAVPRAIVGVAGTKARDYSSATFIPIAEALGLSESTRLYLVAPAVAKDGSQIIARYGLESGVVLERWRETDDGGLQARAWNPYLATVPQNERQVPAWGVEGSTTVSLLEPPNLFDVDFPIDVVYTWVDGTDPSWLERKRAAVEESIGVGLTEEAAADMRFIDHDELRYSLRSIERYAPWVRHIWIVTDRQVPPWLDTEHPKVTVVDHTEIAPPEARLPTFNSHAIEANLHRIDGLSEHFIYFNDDVFLSSPVTPDLFFSPNGIAHMYLSRALVASGEPVEGEPASDSAGKNARRMVLDVCGRRLSRKLFHAPFALQRSVSDEIESRWPAEVAGTRAGQFRQVTDVTLSGATHMNYAYATARAVTRGLRYRYINVGAEDAMARFEKLYADRHVLQTFCLNEATQDRDPAEIDRTVREFLQRMFPDVSTFERLS